MNQPRPNDPDREMPYDNRIKRATWSITTRAFSDAHFAVFPEELIKTPIIAGCPEGGAVLDPFAGSGTTLLAAHKLLRNWIGIELNPEYVALAKKRLTPYIQQQRLESFLCPP
jgi:DNA modification methylase